MAVFPGLFQVLGGLQFAGHTAEVAVRPAAAPAAAQLDAPDVPQPAFRGTLLTSLFIPEALVPGAQATEAQRQSEWNRLEHLRELYMAFATNPAP